MCSVIRVRVGLHRSALRGWRSLPKVCTLGGGENRRTGLARQSKSHLYHAPRSRSIASFEQSVHDEVCGQGGFLAVHHHLGVVQTGTRLFGRDHACHTQGTGAKEQRRNRCSGARVGCKEQGQYSSTRTGRLNDRSHKLRLGPLGIGAGKARHYAAGGDPNDHWERAKPPRLSYPLKETDA